jgi:energy-coupling factor transporter ATP-binding protein EcfA2
MTPQNNLEHYEATEAQELTRLLHAVRPPERRLQVPAPVDLAIRAAIWQASVRRQLIALLSMARRDLIRVIRQALTDNPLLEEEARAADEPTPVGQECAPRFTAPIDDLTDAAEWYDSLWQACVPEGWEASGLPAQASEAPGASAHPSSSPEVLVPDMMITKVGHDYQVCLNEEGLPRLRLSATDRHLGREGEAKQHLEDQLRAAVWLIRSLEHRHQALLKVATSLVTWQRAFLDHGLAYLQPLALSEVAEVSGLHASTVRHVIANKYLSTAHGIVALTAFFQSGLESAGGETLSSLTVKDRIKQLVAAEDPARPLTDQQLVDVLAAEHINIARRTVTKYRRELQLPPANRRQPHGPTAGASRLSPDEEQRVRQALEAHARHRQAELPPQRDREATSGIPPEVQEVQHHRDQEALAWLHLQGIEWWRLAADPEVRAAHRDLQTALAHPQLRPAVLLALRAFAQAAEASVTTPLPAAPVEPWSRLTEPPPLGDREEASWVPPEVEEAQRHRYLAWLEQTRKSPRMQEVSRLVERALHATATVLLTGERGAGKSHLARLLHDQGPRAQGPFITVNCAAIPETFLEAELFGDERGAVTGATQRQRGCLELAAGGTLFLQEIDAMSRVLQAKLLRVLREKRFERLGGTETITTDARIVAATHQDLEGLITEGRFRRDLFYRLNVYPIALPPLRERQEDLGPLTRFFLMRFSAKLRKQVVGISKEALGLLERYPWPGNVRELEAVIEQVVARCQGPMVTVQDLAQALREPSRVMS